MVAGNRSSREGVLSPVSKSMERGASPAHCHVGFGQPFVDQLVYLCRVRSEEGLDLHLWSQSEKRAPTNMRAEAGDNARSAASKLTMQSRREPEVACTPPPTFVLLSRPHRMPVALSDRLLFRCSMLLSRAFCSSLSDAQNAPSVGRTVLTACTRACSRLLAASSRATGVAGVCAGQDI